MMHDFLTNNRDELTRRCRIKVAQRPARGATVSQLDNGVPLFLDQLIRTLRVEQTGSPFDSRHISGPSGGGAAVSEVSISAAQHGKALMLMGFTVDQVVHDYGDLCQAITDLGFERDVPFEVDEFRTLNRCLDNAIADAVTEFGYQRDMSMAAKQAAENNEKQGFFAHELRNLIHTAGLSLAAMKTGQLPFSGATGAVLERSLNNLRVLVDQSLADVRQEVQGIQPAEQFSLANFIDDVQYAAVLAAKSRSCVFLVSAVDPAIALMGKRDLLFSALWNLLHNAFKFTHVDTEVSLTARAIGDRILIDVSDRCGGIDAHALATIFDSFSQSGVDRSGLGLGLSIARDCVIAHGGELTVSNEPGRGCTFTMNLPRHAL
jgi:signal transduction histidine kinase